MATGNGYRKFCEVWTCCCCFWDMQAHRHTDMLIAILCTPTAGEVMNWLVWVFYLTTGITTAWQHCHVTRFLWHVIIFLWLTLHHAHKIHVIIQHHLPYEQWHFIFKNIKTTAWKHCYHVMHTHATAHVCQPVSPSQAGVLLKQLNITIQSMLHGRLRILGPSSTFETVIQTWYAEWQW